MAKEKERRSVGATTNHHSFSNGGNNDYGDSISDLVREVKGKCEIEIFGQKMFGVVIMFWAESVKMYKYSKSAGGCANYN